MPSHEVAHHKERTYEQQSQVAEGRCEDAELHDPSFTPEFRCTLGACPLRNAPAMSLKTPSSVCVSSFWMKQRGLRTECRIC